MPFKLQYKSKIRELTSQLIIIFQIFALFQKSKLSAFFDTAIPK